MQHLLTAALGGRASRAPGTSALRIHGRLTGPR